MHFTTYIRPRLLIKKWPPQTHEVMKLSYNGNEQAYRICCKRSKDLGTLLDNCSWYDKWQFYADLYLKRTAGD